MNWLTVSTSLVHGNTETSSYTRTNDTYHNRHNLSIASFLETFCQLQEHTVTKENDTYYLEEYGRLAKTPRL
jgi:hypothetical protein